MSATAALSADADTDADGSSSQDLFPTATHTVSLRH